MSVTSTDLVAQAVASVRGYSPAQVRAGLASGTVRLVDVREPEELDEHGLIAGAFHVPRGLLEFWADRDDPAHRPELDPEAPTIVYSAAGGRSALAAATLQQLGYVHVGHLDGGIEAWKRAGHPVVGLRPWQLSRTTPPTTTTEGRTS